MASHDTGSVWTAEALFQCPLCGGPLKRATSSALACQACNNQVAAGDGIIDFVAGAAVTSLDNIDYDAFYGINAEHSLELYNVLLRAAGSRWPEAFGNALEIGCGTGGLSLALFSRIAADSVVLTDISPKMLRICRDRLQKAIPDRVKAFTFATYSGTERCYRPDMFNSCFGTAVVHHIVDVPRFLREVNGLLKPGGLAFFMEPNRAFHRALTMTLADIAATFLRDKSVPLEQVGGMLSWVAQVHCSVANSGDNEVLAEREDKHYFEGKAFLAWAREAGFGDVAALPCDPDPTGWGTIQDYMQQSEVNSVGFAALKKAWPSHYKRYFAALKPEDQSPSYLFWLRNTVSDKAVRRGTPARRAVKTVRKAPAELWLQVELKCTRQAVELEVEGWCLADVPVGSVQIIVGQLRKRLPVWLPRADIEMLKNADGRYPALHTLCSGVRGVIRLPPLPPGETSVGVSMQVVCTGGEVLDMGWLVLQRDDNAKKTVHYTVDP